jgi:hypothetical protein
VDKPLYIGLFVVAGFRFVFVYFSPDSGFDAPEWCARKGDTINITLASY